MKPIALSEVALRPYIGKTVYAKLKDGSRIYGKIKAFRDGRLYFASISKGSGPTYHRARKQYAKRNKKKATISFFGFGIGIALGFIASLFFIPFFGYGGGYGGYGGGFGGGYGGCGCNGCGPGGYGGYDGFY
ncbi:hypothetical protein [Paenibacillus sp. HB172176]|uniref:hypothetical protein n=1 Tax=Paenibacillus sp. HB172176 TaxID=2493690 RepID=UPI00143C8D30|nr:hypothetical protein [Paenibacillus sp. HB172176]